VRVAIIGNSHLWALKRAIRLGLFKSDEHEITFWGTGGLGFDTISCEAGIFRTPLRDVVLNVSGGRYESLPAHEFEAIIFHGIFPNVGRYLSGLQKMSDDIRRYSRAYLRDGLQTCIEAEPTYPLVRSLRADYERRVLMSAVPLAPEDSAKSKERSIRGEEFNLVNSCISAILCDMRAEYVAQPSETVCDYRYSKREFLKLPDDDDIHMNGEYGASVLREITAQLSVR
jgi:hypothetical protein